MILIYSSNHMRMWHHLVLALNWSFFDSEGWMLNTHTFISDTFTSHIHGRGKFQSLDRKMLAVQWLVTQGAVSKPQSESVYPPAVWAVRLLCSGQHLTRKKEMNGKIKRQGCQSMTRKRGDTRHTNVAQPPWLFFEWDSLFFKQDLKSFMIECVQILVCGRWLYDCIHRPHLLKHGFLSTVDVAVFQACGRRTTYYYETHWKPEGELGLF
jgi:hypothetical protein